MDATLVTMGAAPIKGSSAMAGDEAVLAQGEWNADRESSFYGDSSFLWKITLHQLVRSYRRKPIIFYFGIPDN